MEISYEQLTSVMGIILGALVTAIGFLTKWILSAVEDLKKKLIYCEEKHDISTKHISELVEKSSRLEGKIEIMQSLNHAELAHKVADAVKAHIDGKN